ncbi:hypothetical protein [Cobetia amphilecti]|uniref:hypothetical protein n=1 Tax=Cobetia amphilecti TaxID=1055104 RepID=UPI00244B1EA7|nr:hypothetical protein [Cobetia litoralis]MDH2420976.1 hypothetical protein [Cobetia litoralis]
MAAAANLKRWIFRSSASDFAGSGTPVAFPVIPATARQLPVMGHDGAQDDGKNRRYGSVIHRQSHVFKVTFARIAPG